MMIQKVDTRTGGTGMTNPDYTFPKPLELCVGTIWKHLEMWALDAVEAVSRTWWVILLEAQETRIP